MRLLGVVAVLLLLLSGCERAKESGALPEVIVRQEWTPNSNYAGVLLAAKEFARHHKIKITVRPGAEGVDPLKLVLLNQATVADVGADKVLQAVADSDVDLVVVGVLNRQSPTCFIAKADRNVRSPQDFEGKRVGILQGTATELVYRTLVAKQKLNKRRLIERQVPFDIKTFLLDEYDIRPAFIYDEPVSLDLARVAYTIIEPRHYGVNFLGTVYVARRETIVSNSELIRGFIAAVADGWKAALKYPEQAIDTLAVEYKGIDKKRELLSLKKAAPYFQDTDGRVLHSEPKDWEGTVQALKDLGVLKKPVDLVRLVDGSFVRQYEESVSARK